MRFSRIPQKVRVTKAAIIKEIAGSIVAKPLVQEQSLKDNLKTNKISNKVSNGLNSRKNPRKLSTS